MRGCMSEDRRCRSPFDSCGEVCGVVCLCCSAIRVLLLEVVRSLTVGMWQGVFRQPAERTNGRNVTTFQGFFAGKLRGRAVTYGF